MRASQFGVVLGVCILAAGCNQEAASTAGPRSPGRYAGIGTFDAGRLWQEMKSAPTPNDQAAAKLADDEHVIVVLDSHTGEIRECGDHTGFCVAMNPWAAGAAGAPVRLTKHAADLQAENEGASTKQITSADTATNQTTSTH